MEAGNSSGMGTTLYGHDAHSQGHELGNTGLMGVNDELTSGNGPGGNPGPSYWNPPLTVAYRRMGHATGTAMSPASQRGGCGQHLFCRASDRGLGVGAVLDL